MSQKISKRLVNGLYPRYSPLISRWNNTLILTRTPFTTIYFRDPGATGVKHDNFLRTFPLNESHIIWIASRFFLVTRSIYVKWKCSPCGEVRGTIPGEDWCVFGSRKKVVQTSGDVNVCSNSHRSSPDMTRCLEGIVLWNFWWNRHYTKTLPSSQF